MRLVSPLVPLRRAHGPALPPGNLVEAACTVPGASADAIHWVTRRADARRAEWRRVVATIEVLLREYGGDQRRAALAYAELERRGSLRRRYVSPGMSAEGLLLWWARVGRRPPTPKVTRVEHDIRRLTL